MKIIKRAGKTVVKMSRSEWEKIGQAAGWGEGGYGFRNRRYVDFDDTDVTEGVYEDEGDEVEIGDVGVGTYEVGDAINFSYDIEGGEEGEVDEETGRIVQVLTDETSGESVYIVKDSTGKKHTVPQSRVL